MKKLTSAIYNDVQLLLNHAKELDYKYSKAESNFQQLKILNSENVQKMSHENKNIRDELIQGEYLIHTIFVRIILNIIFSRKERTPKDRSTKGNPRKFELAKGKRIKIFADKHKAFRRFSGTIQYESGSF